MSYDEKLAERIRRALPATASIVEKRMFGGLAFLLDGKMTVGVAGTELMVRVGADAYESALARRHARPMDFTGRPLTGFVYVAPAGTRTVSAVRVWVKRSLEFVATIGAAKRERTRRRRRQARRLTRPGRSDRR